MAVQTYSNASVLLRNAVPRKRVDPSSRPTDFFNLLVQRGRMIPGVEPFKHAIVTGNGSTAERYSESQALPDGARVSTQEFSLSAYYWREVVKVTGRVADINRGGGFIDDVLMAEQENATANLLYKVETDILGSTANLGIISMVDDSDTYGGINPATYTVHASYVTPTVGSVTAAKWEDHWEAMQTAPYQCRPTDVLLATNQHTNYVRIMGPSASSTPSRIVLAQPGTPGGAPQYDIGMHALPPSYNGTPLRVIQNFSTTDILFFDMNDATFYVQRDLRYEPLGKRNDDTEGFVSMAGALVIDTRRKHSKMEGVTA